MTQAMKARHILRSTVADLVRETREREAAGAQNLPMPTNHTCTHPFLH